MHLARNPVALPIDPRSLLAGALICAIAAQSGLAAEAPAQPAAASGTALSDAERARYFESKIAPLLAQRCVECHGGKSRKGRLDLSRKETAFAGGKSGQAIVPGRASDSLLWKQVESDEMPEDGPPLPPEEKKLLREWIDAGAVWSSNPTVPLAHVSDRPTGHNGVRRLTVPEYIETVRSAVGVNVEREARDRLPRDLRADGFHNTAYNLNADLGHVEAYARLAEVVVERMDVMKFAADFCDCQELSDACLRRAGRQCASDAALPNHG
ncbi:MAG: DUF1587 domain-containing protein [Verrucomicrobia bacterium]|nr:DUF1587 domain-containing protein [Verrucomicrobiota bacterium]